MKWPVLLFPLLLAVACAPVRQPAPEPAEVLPPLAHAAVEEWEAWGRVVIEGWPEERPADTAATPARFDRLVEYWYAVPGNSGVARRLMMRRAGLAEVLYDPYAATEPPVEEGVEAAAAPAPPPPEDIGYYNTPAWSAAFIAYVARRAGIGEDALPAAPTHARYIDQLLRRAILDTPNAAFLPYAPEERAPQPGDLLCSDRSYNPLSHWSERLADRGRFRPMHCDVVVRRRPRIVEVVGGNVADMVVLRRFPADDEGRLLPAPPGKPVFLLILAPNETGGAAEPPALMAERESGLAVLASLPPAPPRRAGPGVRRRVPVGIRSASCRSGATCRPR